GVRSVLNKGLREYLQREQPDILCLQETRVEPELAGEFWKEHYQAYWNVAARKGYSGTALFSRVPALKTTNGIEIPEHDNEGRVLTAEFQDYFVVNVYVPN